MWVLDQLQFLMLKRIAEVLFASLTSSVTPCYYMLKMVLVNAVNSLLEGK